MKDYAIFLDWNEEDPKAYGVLALHTPFEELVSSLPVMVKAVLFPFNGRIIYDGMLVAATRFFFGSGYKRSMNESLGEAKAQYGIIRDLLIDSGQRPESDEEMLRFYLRSESNRKKYSAEIWEIIERESSLKIIYHQELGKADARYYGKRLREIGVGSGWYAILQGTIIASGITRGDVENVVQQLVPGHMKNYFYYFHFKK